MNSHKDIVLVIDELPTSLDVSEEINYIIKNGRDVGVHIVSPVIYGVRENGVNIVLKRSGYNEEKVIEGVILDNERFDRLSPYTSFTPDLVGTLEDELLRSALMKKPGVVEIGINQASGKPILVDIVKESPINIKGNTCSGKSSVTWSIINSILAYNEEFDLYMIEALGIEFVELTRDSRVKGYGHDKESARLVIEGICSEILRRLG